MRFEPSKSKPGTPNPFQATTEANTQPAGAGVGTPRKRPGIGKPEKTGRRVRPFAQTLGDTPPRDGPFAPMAAQVAVAAPPKARVNQARRKTTGMDPTRLNGGGR